MCISQFYMDVSSLRLIRNLQNFRKAKHIPVYSSFTKFIKEFIHVYITELKMAIFLSTNANFNQVYSFSLISYRCGVIYIIFKNNLGLYGDAFFGSNCIFQHFICNILACYKDKQKKIK